MYRPFVISRALNSKTGHENVSFEDEQAYSRCLDEVKATIFAIAGFWDKHEHTRQAAWYALYDEAIDPISAYHLLMSFQVFPFPSSADSMHLPT